ncbi:MAG: hypothetical protein ACP5NK_07615, partial [Thermoplasmata archaeon]
MPWVPAKSLEKTVLNILLSDEKDNPVSMKSFKKDRVVTITRTDNGFLVEEKGFRNVIYSVEVDRIKKTLREIIRNEFPRSHQILVTVSSR